MENLKVILGEIKSKEGILKHQKDVYFPLEQRQGVDKFRRSANERLLELYQKLKEFSPREISQVNPEEALKSYENSIKLY